MSTKKRENLADYIGINSKCSLSLVLSLSMESWIYLYHIHSSRCFMSFCMHMTDDTGFQLYSMCEMCGWIFWRILLTILMKQVFGTLLFKHMYRQPVWVLIILPLARNRQINSFAIAKSMRLLFVNGWWDCSWYAKRIRSQTYFSFISLSHISCISLLCTQIIWIAVYYGILLLL